MTAKRSTADELRELRELRELAIRLSWNLVADEDECTCAPAEIDMLDECPLCHAQRVLGDDFPREFGK